MPTIARLMAIHTYDVGLCQLLVSDGSSCGRLLDAERAKCQPPASFLFKYILANHLIPNLGGYREIILAMDNISTRWNSFCESHSKAIKAKPFDYLDFPIQWDRSKPLVEYLFDIYKSYIDELRNNHTLSNSEIETVTDICNNILLALNNSVNGVIIDPSTLIWLNNLLKQAVYTINPSNKYEKTHFWRMRKEEYSKLQKTDFYHLPFNLIHLSKSERFSAAGYPCFYIGYSEECCIKEMDNQPGQLIEMELAATEQIKIIDFSFFQDSQRNQINLFEWWPILAACYVTPSRNALKEFFKEEYLFPQLLTKYILYLRDKEETGSAFNDIKGIRYYSCKEPNLNPQSVDYLNLVLFTDTQSDKNNSPKKTLKLPYNPERDEFDNKLMNKFIFMNPYIANV